MDDDAPAGLRRRILSRLEQTVTDMTDNQEFQQSSRRIIERGERVMIQLERTATVLYEVAKLEYQVVRAMVPIVEDLAELTRHTLNDLREQRGLAPKPTPDAQIIDVEAGPAKGDSD